MNKIPRLQQAIDFLNDNHTMINSCAAKGELKSFNGDIVTYLINQLEKIDKINKSDAKNAAKQSSDNRMEQQKRAASLKQSMSGQIFRHFKGNFYQVDTIAIHSETSELRVIYHSMSDPTLVWDRNLDMFLSPVDKMKYPDVEQELRFQPVTEDDLEKIYHASRTIFAIINNKLIYGPKGSSHKDWLIGQMNMTEDKFDNTVRGYIDDKSIYFYMGDFETNNLVEATAVHFMNQIDKNLPVYCGCKKGRIGEKWEPISILRV